MAKTKRDRRRNTFWLINVHTRACFGPYDSADEARGEQNSDPHPEDWLVVKPVVPKTKTVK